MRSILLPLIFLLATGCSSQHPNQAVTGMDFPEITGQSLEKETVRIPSDFASDYNLLLVGYKQNSQFDIDRWLIGLDMTQTKIDTFEIPTIAGLFPQMFSTTIDNGMRRGIPKELWKGVITVYEDGEKVQAFTGNQNPNNARVILLNSQGQIVYFYDDGFSVAALNTLRSHLPEQ